MKFMTIPNEQWVIRREAYHRVQEGLRAAGIEFAHRQVTVHVPGGENEDKKGVAGDAPASNSVCITRYGVGARLSRIGGPNSRNGWASISRAPQVCYGLPSCPAPRISIQ